jgi:hypothetical protein
LEELKLKYNLLTSNAKAKYDKKKKSLRIVIPVDQTINYVPEKIEEPHEQKKEEVVEDETWKNKVLDFSEPSVTIKMLDKEEVTEERPKLVEEIDEEDIVEEPKAQPEVANEEEEISEETPKTPKKFTISNYYNKSKK